jgi:hypothetical protein
LPGFEFYSYEEDPFRPPVPGLDQRFQFCACITLNLILVICRTPYHVLGGKGRYFLAFWQATAAKANEILATMSGYLTGDAPAAPPLELPPLEPEPLLEAASSEPLSSPVVISPVVIPPPPVLPSIVPVPFPASKPAAPWRRALTRCTTATLL